MDEDTSTQKHTPITVDDLLNLRMVSDAQVHPDGSVVAYTVAANVSEPHQKHVASRIWLVPIDGGPARPVSAEGTRAIMPRWSPEGRCLAFLGSRTIDGKAQLFLLDRDWGEARELTNCPGGVVSYTWGPNAGELTLLVTDSPPDDEEDRKKSGKDQIVYERDHRFTRLWIANTESGEIRQLLDADLQVYEFDWSASGDDLVALVSDAPYNWAWYNARLVRIDRSNGQIATILEHDCQLTFPTWSPDASEIAVITSTFSDEGMTGGDVLLIDRDGNSPRNITDGHPRSYLAVDWEHDGQRLLCAAIEGGESTIGYLSRDGTFDPLWREQVSILRWGGPAFSRTRGRQRIAAVRSAPTEPAEVWIAEIAGDRLDWSRLTNTNPEIGRRQVGTVETLHWPSFDGTRIHGLLVRPTDTSPGEPLPMVVLIHGGPTALWGYEFPGERSRGWIPLLIAHGYAVLLSNPRGSMGFGRSFAEANIGDMGGGDLADILAGVDYCIQKGIADPQRLGVAGWSYGGYLTPWAITQTDRFKAAVSGASITNWVSFHGVSTIPSFDASFYKVDPFNWDGHYGQFSPMAHVRRVQTPTLFLHGERDEICPVGQAHEMWRALTEIGVETELVVYPREGHGIREREHAHDVLERAVEWLSERV